MTPHFTSIYECERPVIEGLSKNEIYICTRQLVSGKSYLIESTVGVTVLAGCVRNQKPPRIAYSHKIHEICLITK